MNIKDIHIVGITQSAINNNPKTTAFIFDSTDHSLYGVAYFTGAFWNVTSYGQSLEQSLKEKIRRKIAKISPDQHSFPIITDIVKYFHEQDYPLKQSSDAQKNFIHKLIGFCPAILYSSYASDFLDGYKLYQSVFVEKNLFIPYLKHYENEQQEIVNLVENFKKEPIIEQFNFIEQWGNVMQEMNNLLQKSRNHEKNSSIKMKL